jgi:hypothetical protein
MLPPRTLDIECKALLFAQEGVRRLFSIILPIRESAAMQNREQELWACALWVETHQGDQGPRYIGEQVTRLALEGNAAGVETWRAIADRYDALQQRSANA